MKKFKVIAKVVTYSYLEVEANSKEEAICIASKNEEDFITTDEGYFEIINESVSKKKD